MTMSISFAPAATDAPISSAGAAVVRAALSGGVSSVDFRLTAGPPAYLVQLHTNSGAFVSRQNGSRPAVDTIPAGATVVWTLDPFDYDLHGVMSVGTPSFPGGGDFPYANPSTVRALFTTPGIYKYEDPYSGAAGIIVVR